MKHLILLAIGITFSYQACGMEEEPVYKEPEKEHPGEQKEPGGERPRSPESGGEGTSPLKPPVSEPQTGPESPQRGGGTVVSIGAGSEGGEGGVHVLPAEDVALKQLQQELTDIARLTSSTVTTALAQVPDKAAQQITPSALTEIAGSRPELLSTITTTLASSMRSNPAPAVAGITYVLSSSLEALKNAATDVALTLAHFQVSLIALFRSSSLIATTSRGLTGLSRIISDIGDNLAQRASSIPGLASVLAELKGIVRGVSPISLAQAYNDSGYKPQTSDEDLTNAYNNAFIETSEGIENGGVLADSYRDRLDNLNRMYGILFNARGTTIEQARVDNAYKQLGLFNGSELSDDEVELRYLSTSGAMKISIRESQIDPATYEPLINLIFQYNLIAKARGLPQAS